MDVDSAAKGEGFRSYYIQKIEELQLIVNDKIFVVYKQNVMN